MCHSCFWLWELGGALFEEAYYSWKTRHNMWGHIWPMIRGYFGGKRSVSLCAVVSPFFLIKLLVFAPSLLPLIWKIFPCCWIAPHFNFRLCSYFLCRWADTGHRNIAFITSFLAIFFLFLFYFLPPCAFVFLAKDWIMRALSTPSLFDGSHFKYSA